MDDSGNVLGISNDLALTRNSVDRFSNLLTTLISDKIGVEYSPYIKIKFKELNNEQICIVDVDPSPIPAFLLGDKGSEFYIRFGPTSRMLDAEGTHNYINLHWN